jgi:hypothetical protein
LVPGQRSLGLSFLAKAKLLEQFRKTLPRGGIGDAKVLLNFAEIAAGGEEDAEHFGLLFVECTELTWPKHTSEFAPTGGTAQPDDR